MKKWVLVLTLPSGNLYVLGPKDDGLALFPVTRGQPNLLKGVFGFDTESEARTWMAQTAALSEKGARLLETVQPMLSEAIN